MRNKLNGFLLFFLFLILISFSFSEEKINFIKADNGFYFFKVKGDIISIKENNSSFKQTFIDTAIDSFSNISFRKVNSRFLLYLTNENKQVIYGLKDNLWEKLFEIDKNKQRFFDDVELSHYQNKNNFLNYFQLSEIKDNILSIGNIKYVLPETFDDFFIEKDKIYIMKVYEKTIMIKEFKIKAGLPYPPLGVTGVFHHNYSLYSEEYLNEIKWAPNPLNSSILNYYIYKKDTSKKDANFVFETKIPPATYFYLDRELKKEDEGRFVYGVSVVDITLGESDIVTTTGNIIKPTFGPLKSYIFNIQ